MQEIILAGAGKGFKYREGLRRGRGSDVIKRAYVRGRSNVCIVKFLPQTILVRTVKAEGGHADLEREKANCKRMQLNDW